MANWFEFNGVKSTDKGLLVSGKSIYTAPQRDYELIHVPGRSGDVLIDNGCWKNVDVKYSVNFLDLPSKAAGLHDWLQATNYYALRDSYQPGYYRYGLFSSILDPEELAMQAGSAQLTFNCKPYLYRNPVNPTNYPDDRIQITSDSHNGVASSITSPENMATLADGVVTINNPEPYASAPLIQVFGSTPGDVSFAIGSKTYSLTLDITSVSLYIDSELMTAYTGTTTKTLKTQNLSFTQFPVLEPGANIIQFSSGIKWLRFYPRWRRI